MDSEEVDMKEEDKVACSLLSGHSNDVSDDRGSCEVERVQEV